MTFLARAGSSTLAELVTNSDVSSSRGGRTPICVIVKIAREQPAFPANTSSAQALDVSGVSGTWSQDCQGICVACAVGATGSSISCLSGPGGPGAWLCHLCWEAQECLAPHSQQMWLYGQLLFVQPKEQLNHRHRRLP